MGVSHLLYLLLTYLVASVPFGLVITTLYGRDADIRRSGSGNIGATNVARVYGWAMAGWVVLLDALKGLLPTAGALWLWPEAGLWWPGLVALTAFMAHCYPVYLEFRGGKGVATGAGGLLALSPWATVPAIAVWMALLKGSGRSSVAALGAATSLVGLSWWLDPDVLPVVVMLCLGILTTHVPNIRRLIRGEEKTIVRPVRWGRTTEDATHAEALLAQGPAGGRPTPLWKERIDPLAIEEPPAS
ncbi:MAG TPA: glycerol-3-phosphate 1-O-acyltransferase [Deltaproteobacteria bacterium]|nr:glycerol-3-phosphate 1-O-acyltransferase [Deltaproteobacteria bacterium]